MAFGRPSRRQFLGGLAAVALPFAGCRGENEDRQTPTPVDDPPDGSPSLSDLAVGLAEVGHGFVAPVSVEIPVPGRLFVADQPGRVYLHADGKRRTFLDLTDRVIEISGDEERGLLDIAFHPKFDTNGRFYARYSAPPTDETPASYSHRSILSEFQTEPDATSADPGTERRLLDIPQPQPNHNGGDVLFGPDDYLYVSLGDGGGAGDAGFGHVSDWYDPVRGGNGQDVTENLLGSILRIDVDTVDGDKPYAIPPENPLVGENGLDEQFAWGFRSPWGLSFGPDDHLYAADMGQDKYEEVNVVERGGNYGWNVREGTHCFRQDSCPRAADDGTPLKPPVIEYEHEEGVVSGVAVVGGYIYEGSELTAMDGLYVFADWRAEGKLFAARPTDSGLWETGTIDVVDDVEPYVLAFGRGLDGELYICTNERGRVQGETGTVYRLESA